MEETNLIQSQQSAEVQTNPSTPLRVGLLPVMDLIKNSFGVYKDRVWVLLGLLAIAALSGLALLPGAILMVVLTALINASSYSTSIRIIFGIIGFGLFLAGIIFTLVIGLWCQIAIICAIEERASKIGIKQSLAMAWPNFWSFAWVGVLLGVVCFVGVLLLVVPGIIFVVWFGFALFVLVAEGIKGTNALKQSKQLVAGYWWGVAGRILLLCLVNIVLSWIPILGFILMIVFITPFSQIYNYLIYEDLKRIKA